METIHPICCGLDVHQASVSACLRRVNADGAVSVEAREFSTTVKGLTALADWLVEEGCPIAAMESTGVYWKPVWHILSPLLDVWVLNARDVKQRRGKKRDRADAKWIAELVAHVLVQPSFVPPARIGALRDLVRMRTTLVHMRTQVKNRVLAILEDTNIKLASVASDPFGASGRKILDALVKGERDAKVLSELAMGVLRRKIPQLEEALQGSFTEHHAFLIRLGLESVDQSNRQIRELDSQIGSLMEPMREEVSRLTSIPGVSETAARVILSEIGTDMTRFGSTGRLASWAGLCPGNNESAGKRLSGKTCKGNRYLRRITVECAWATRNTDTFLGQTFCRLQARIGGKKAAVAVAHKILVIAFHLLNEGELYDDGRYDLHKQRERVRRTDRALKTLERLGYRVQVTLAS
jgi:transposase